MHYTFEGLASPPLSVYGTNQQVKKTLNIDRINVTASKILNSRDSHEFLYSLLK
jgi:hypothetical protein